MTQKLIGYADFEGNTMVGIVDAGEEPETSTFTRI